MPTPENRLARQRASLAIVTVLLFAAGLALLVLPLRLPIPVRLMLAAGNLIGALVLFAVLKQRRPRA
ncbi:MAG: hypothetical protein ABII82_03595 [Verrucomicrobiota bacterium]